MKTINEKEVLDRVLHRVQYEMNITKAEFCRRLDIGTQNLNNWISRGKIPSENLPKISNVIGKTVNWILYGEDLFSPKGLLDTPPDINDEFAHIDQYDIMLSAGHGSYVPDYQKVTDRLSFKRKWLTRKGLNEKNLAVLYADGDSMNDRICDGDVLLIDLSNKRPSPGGIYAIFLNGVIMVKRIIITTQLILHSDNSDKTTYPDIPITDGDQFEIIGRIVWVGGDI